LAIIRPEPRKMVRKGRGAAGQHRQTPPCFALLSSPFHQLIRKKWYGRVSFFPSATLDKEELVTLA